MESKFKRAMDVVKMNIESDPFSTGKTRAFYVAVKCLIKSAETGKGVFLAQKLFIPTIYSYALEVADVTGTIEAIMDEVAVAAKAVAIWGAGAGVKEDVPA